MQRIVKVYVVEQRKRLDINGKVLEIGAYDVNGNLNEELEGCDHVRLDMRDGPNVDVVANSHDMPFPDDTFDAVVCVDTFEHDNAFWVTMEEIHRVIKPGGAIVICVPTIGFVLHGHPNDYWRFTESAMKELLSGCTDVDTKLIVKVKPHIEEVFGSGKWKE